jgi:amino acid adenylation domain-containing protein
MMPSAFVLLEHLPLTPNGKVDRKALPAPEQGRTAQQPEYLAPRTAIEEMLADVFGQVLELEQVSRTESFFDLGGHSLLATQVISRLRQLFEIELPLRSLFESPAIAELGAQVERALRGEAGAEVRAMVRVARVGGAGGAGAGGGLPLSYAQQRLWFLEQLEPGGSTYNVPVGVRLSGQLKVRALEETLSEVVRRHEVLRTRFAEEGGRAVQVVGEAAEVRLVVEELDGLSEEEREAEVKRQLSQEAQRPFNLAQGPLLRVRLWRLSEEEHVLQLTMHHIISDGWSMSVLIKEVAVLYETYSRGEKSPLAELAIQYGDFAVWQREWLGSGVLEEQLEYWRGQLGGELPVLEMETDRQPSGLGSNGGAGQRLELGVELTEQLKEMSRREGVTLFMTLLAAWQTLLYRYTGQDDVIVGTDVANRNRMETEGLIGFFVNQLVMRTDLSGDPSFSELLKRVKEVCLGAYAHQDVPFEKLVEELQPERSLSLSPIYQVMFVLQNMPIGTLELSSLKLSNLENDSRTTKFDLVMLMTEEADGLSGTIEYSTDLFDSSSISRLAAHFKLLLDSIIANPLLPLSSLNLLSSSERLHLLSLSNQAPSPFPALSSIHLLFEQQVRRTPLSIALCFDDHLLSYAQLNARANQLAHYLRSLGVGPDVLVAICLHRSVELIVGLLGILKAGGAYLPLDPAYPQERLSFMLDDAQVQVLLTEDSLLDTLPAHWGYTFCLDSQWPDIASLSSLNPAPLTDSDNLAYVIYTSGSSGLPKGVCITHRAVNRLVCETDYLQIMEGDVVAQASNVSFDAATFEIWGALLHGARLQGVRKEVMVSPPELAAQIERDGMTILFLTTALFNQVARAAPGSLKGMRAVLFGGQMVDPGSVREVLEAGYAGRLVHVYGPTESTTFATWQLVEGVAAGARTIPIGRAIANTSVYILDGGMGMVAEGVLGELYLGGAGLARGYLGGEELSGEKFVPHPYSEAGGERLYRTGDVARHVRGGEIEFMGRVDEQVKVRGYRIELGEIEAVLMEHAAVRECVVVAVEKEETDKQLVAYVVAQADGEPTSKEMREHLKEKLPEYMMPSAFVLLEHLPLTPNGKVDRKALPAPEQGRTAQQPEYLAPRTVVEEILAGIWCEVLKVGQVGVNDDFFELGGHSLLATQVVSRARESLGVDVEIRQLFESPTVAELAQEIESSLKGEPEAEIPLLVRVSREQTLPLSFAQQRLWFINKLAPESPFYNMPYGVRLTGELDLAALGETLSEIIRRHESLRTCFVEVDGQPQQIILPASKVSLDVQDLSALPEGERQAEVQRLASEEAQRPFDLRIGPVRMRLLRASESEHVLLLTLHHITSDGWSMSILIREVAALYETYRQGQESSLAELSIQYADFAMWQRKWLQGEVLDRQLSYWKRQLAGAPSVLELPTDRARPPVQSFHGAYEPFKLSRGLSEELQRLSRHEGATLYMTLLAAWQILLSRYAAQEDVVVGSPIANRNRKELEDLIGFFVNTLVLRTDLSGNPTFIEVLKRVREVTLGAYAHQDLPFEKLVEELQPERSLSHSPLFQVMFTLQNAPVGALQLTGLNLSVVNTESTPVMFDLLLNMHERADGISGTLGYNLDLFDGRTIKNMIAHFKQLLEAIAKDTERQLSGVSLLTGAEQQLISRWNETDAASPRDARLPELFEWQAEQTPGAVALIFGDTEITYGELNKRANQLAHYLQSLCVGPEIPVGLYLETSIETVVGLLAILKAGGSYVPLDTQYPSERLAFMLEDTRMPFVLTQQALLPSLPESQAMAICLDADWKKIASHSGQNPECAATASSAAYLIYTSGSTGRPKAVLVEHRNAVNIINASRLKFNFTAADIMPGLASSTFDISLFELLAPLTTGAKVVLCSRHDVMDLPGLARTLEQCTLLHMVPSLMRQFIEVVDGSDTDRRYERLRRIFIGGDAVPPELLRKMAKTFPQARIEVLYGPTETAIFCTSVEVSLAEAESRFVIGRPLDNVKIRICDGFLNLTPIGVAGEICIGGAGVTRGYLNQDGLTREKFVNLEGHRYYRSGDRGRYLPDGRIEFLGRLDNQVKVRGFRVELGEVEAALASHPAVRQAVVVAHADPLSGKKLVAYVVPEPADSIACEVSGAEAPGDELSSDTPGSALHSRQHHPGIEGVKAYLQERLPAYMVPSAFILIDEIPLTPNGKVDRSALPSPEQARATSEQEYVAPQTLVEDTLAGIYAQVLELEQVSRLDSFFDLGGHSLLATQVISRIRELFQVELPLRCIFESPTVAGLSEVIEDAVLAKEQQVTPQATEIIPLNRDAYRID